MAPRSLGAPGQPLGLASGWLAPALSASNFHVVGSVLTLVVDRPFRFFIRHDATSAILCQGRVLDPSK